MKCRTVLLLLTLLAFTGQLFGMQNVYLSGVTLTYTQPTSETFTAVRWGHCFMPEWETTDGYQIVAGDDSVFY